MELYPVFWELFVILGVFGGRPKYPWKNIGNTQFPERLEN